VHKFPTDAMDVLEALGEAGMSSEESEGEQGVNTRHFYIKHVPWRHPGLTKWLHLLDQYPRGASGSLGVRSYAKQTRRRLENKYITSLRDPPLELSHTFYDPSWLAAQSSAKRRSLKISSNPVKISWNNGH
jgi:hypothetical protein